MLFRYLIFVGISYFIARRIEIYFWKEFPPYDRISVFIKNNSLNKYVSNSNEKFKIYSEN